MPNSLAMLAAPLGRVLLSAIFVLSAVHKFGQWDGTVAFMTSQGVVAASALLPIVVALELFGGLSVLLGLFARWGAVALLIFMVPVTLVIHDFWTYEGAEQQQQMIHFLKNVSIMGGLLLILSFGPGPLSIDHFRFRARPPVSAP